MKKILALCIALCAAVSLYAETKPLKELLPAGKWYNDEYSFTFTSSMFSKKYKAYYTFGSVNGSMTGTFQINGDGSITIKKGDIAGSFNTACISGDELKLAFTGDPQNPKAAELLHNDDDSFVLWHDTSFVPADKKVLLHNGSTPCITLGYKLNSTTDNVRIRKGPGTEYESMTFNYKDQDSGEIKSSGSVRTGTNIRVLARTADKMKVNEWFNYWYYVEYKEPLNDLIVYKTAWMFGEFINVPENKDRQITVKTPENEESYYGSFTVSVEGSVTGAPVKMRYQIKNSYGNVVKDKPVGTYAQEAGTFAFEISKEDETLFIGSNTVNVVAVYSDKKTVSKQVTFYVHEGGGEMAKPVIYLYPEKTTKVRVEVKPQKGIAVSIPDYGTGWNVTASPDGSIINDADGKKYTYLFWESRGYDATPMKEGFVVKKEDLSRFFADELSVLGLNDAEIKDFLEFWIPQMNKAPWYAVSFISRSDLDAAAPLSVTPKPDTVIRVFFDSKPLQSPVKMKEQKLVPVKRKGFTVTEWGGMRYDR